MAYPVAEGIPIFLSHDPRFASARRVSGAYDSLYCRHPHPWRREGRDYGFFGFFASLLARFPANRFLELGCGEGDLLAAVTAGDKYAVDLSRVALELTRTKTDAHLSVALAERLPFPGEYFDLVAGVGVMEHFLDVHEAMREIWRVLRPGGHYVALTHVTLTLGERLVGKLTEYVMPRPRPVTALRWLIGRWQGAARPELVEQPIQNRYTTRDGARYFRASGFRLLDVIHTRRYPGLPLSGPWVVIYIARK
ncbi:MAG: class I SAM-dependent methyltransferase [Candidatus Rokubacteria bacterium]|nr:class I SAM-dependent methyltransferase [Candidatus Rokubacteria bacterium]